MKVVLLAGGFGTRISDYSDVIPKPTQSSKTTYSSSETKLLFSSKIESEEKYKFK